VWLGHPLSGGNTGGPAEPVPRYLTNGPGCAGRGLSLFSGARSLGASNKRFALQ
jgi:hypothetical protein